MVPKIFHLTCKDRVIPARFRKNIDIIESLFPDHEIRIHHDEDIINFAKRDFPQYYEKVIGRMTSFIMVVDTVRYMWMHRYGGIYADMDICFRRKFEFDDGVIFVEREWTYPKDDRITESVHNCLFASEQNHPIWIEILDGIAQNVDGLKRQNNSAIGKFANKVLVKAGLRKRQVSPVFNVTGPNAISRIIGDRSLLQKYDDVRVVPGSAIFQRGWSKQAPGQEFFEHETAQSWGG